MNFTNKEFERRLDLVIDSMAKDNIDVLITMTPENIYYLTGFDSYGYYQYAAAIVNKDRRVVLVIRNIEETQAKGQSWLKEIVPYKIENDNPVMLTVDILQQMVGAKGRIGIEESSFFLTVDTYEIFKIELENCEFIDQTYLIKEIRLIKSDEELVYVRKAAEFTDLAHEVCLENIKVGQLETQLHGKMIGAMHEAGADWLSTPVLMNCEGMWVHKTPFEKPFEKGKVLCTELNGCYKRYNSTASRAFSIGKPSPKVLEVYSIVKQALEAACEAAKPGVRIYELDVIARKIITDAGYGEAHLHRTSFGVGVGYPVFCFEHMSSQPNDHHTLEPGMVITIEPSIYLDDFAIRLGDNLIITDDGAEVVHKFSRELAIIDC